jgi:hypothetical protein
MANDNERASPSFFSKFAALVDSGILKELKPAELRLLLAIARYMDFDTGWAYPSREKLRALTGLSFHAIATGLKGLVARGKIEKKRASKRLGFRNQYRVLCFCVDKVHQSKDIALVQERYTKAHGEKDAESPPDPAFVHNSFHCFGAGKVHENPIEPLKKEREEREERSASPPTSSQNEKNKTKEAQKIVSEVSGSLLTIPKTPISPLFEKGHRKRVDTGEKAFAEEIKKILSPKEVGEKQA